MNFLDSQNANHSYLDPKDDEWHKKNPKPRSHTRIKSRRSVSKATSDTSADEPLFIASKRQCTGRKSLSSISNSSTLAIEGPADPLAEDKNKEGIFRDRLTWDAINDDIVEWQSVCQTSRPSWWFPSTKWTVNETRTHGKEVRSRASTPRQSEIDKRIRPRFIDKQRRAVTDSYLTDDNNSQTLAHLIAIQLLSSCFTLPPNQAASNNSTAYHCFDTLGSADLQNPKLISSLRMYTNSRYALSFEHRGQITSPAYAWQGAYDGTSLGGTPEASADSLAIEQSGRISRKRSVHRALYATEGSADKSPLGTYAAHLDKGGLTFPVTPMVVQRRRGFKGKKKDIPLSNKSARPGRGQSSSAELPCSRSHMSPFPSPGAQVSSGKSCPGTSKNTLQSSICSKPNPVFISVKGLVVKRWQTFRRIFSHGLSYGCPDSYDSTADFVSQFSSLSTSPASPYMSSDGKERRRRARERQDIHSSSMDSSPHYNTPASAAGSEIISPTFLDVPTPPISRFADSDQIGITATSIQRRLMGSSGSQTPSPFPPSTPNNSVASSADTDSTVASQRSESGFFSNRSKSRGGSNTPSFTPRHVGRRTERRSLLSEVCTAEDMDLQGIFTERNPASALGSTLATPAEESGSEGTIGLASSTLIFAPANSPTSSHDVHLPPLPISTEYSPSHDQMFGMGMDVGTSPRLTRTSSSGTALFTPNEEGVETEDLPVGSGAHIWRDDFEGSGKKGERSFL